MEEEVQILPINPETFETQEYNILDQKLLTVSELDTIFSSSTDYIEVSVYDENQNKIYSTPEGEVLTTYNVKEGDILLQPQQDLERLGFDIDSYFINYNFYRKRLNSNSTQKYFISQISSDRTEIAIDSNNIELDQILTSSAEFIQFREDADYFVDFYLNFGSNQYVIANNIKINNEQVLIKLYEPLPDEFDVKSTLWVVEVISTPQTYKVTFPFTPEIPDDFTFISGPNFNLEVQGETGTVSENFSYNTLINSNVTSSINQIQNLLAEKQININVNYEDFNQFIHFSSAKTRLENFYYKVGLIESAQNQISSFLNQVTSNTKNTSAYSSSKAELTSQINTIIKNFDGYEYFMYFNSGSQFSYPKSNTSPPYSLYPTGSTEVLDWIGSADPTSQYYGGMALSASNFDQENQDWLYWAIPEYLRTDPENIKYELFVDMVAQHYDNIWLYTKDITNKFDADNRLNYGISKDLIADAIKDFGVKLYSNNFNNNDLFSSFLGITPSGNLFPFPETTGSLPTPSGYEYVDTRISASNDIVPLDDVNKRLYKRIYHNLPYLLKTKGTIAGLRSLITSYGIPDTILRINEFGGKDRNEDQDWDLEQRVFNYAFNTGPNSTNYVSSSFNSNPSFGEDSPNTLQFRFKTAGIPTPTSNIPSPDIRYSQSLFSTNDGGNLILEYNGSGLTTGSYLGSSIDPYDYYGILKWIPSEQDTPSISASVYLPVFDGGWWSVQINMEHASINSSSLFVANQIDGKVGFNASSSIGGFDGSYYSQASIGYLNKDTNLTLDNKIYTPFSGSFQELRYFNQEISQSKFYDYVLNPYSVEGNDINSTPDQLFFRAALGTQLNTGSRTSIHPRVTGSISQITQSFSSDSSFYVSTPEFIANVEKIYQDQVPVGIKNRVTDKINLENIDLAESPYGFKSGSSITQISTQNSLSPFQSVQQKSFVSQSYTPDVNYLEVAFSPQNQINDDINAQLGYFNLGDYIGDPRHISSSDRSYPNLDTLRDAYFEKYIKGYDVKDFIRLIKFFDNSLFKMIKDFTPARTSLSSGVVVKQHILERNRQRPAQVSWENVTYSGSIKPQSRNYNTGSSDTGQYEYNNGSSIYKFSGGTGGSFEKFNGLQSNPNHLDNRFNLTQSYSESIEGSVANTLTNEGNFVGYKEIIISDQKEFYDGEFSGSNLTVTELIANPGCDPYKKVSDDSIFFKPIVFNLTPGVNTQGTVNEEEIVSNLNSPNSGDAWVISEQVQNNPPLSKVKYIKLSNTDSNGISIANYLEASPSIKWVTPDASVVDGGGVVEYIIEGVTTFANSTLLRISQTEGDNITQTSNSINYFPITSSQDAGSENWSLSASGNFTTSNNLSQSNDNLQQGNFINPASNYQKQYFWYWNGNEIGDAQSFFNSGSETIPFSTILTNPAKFTHGAYNPKRTSNIPWFFSASIAYSASDLGLGNSITSSNNVYHSSSKYSGLSLYDQDFFFTTGNFSGVFKPSPLVTDVQNSIFKSDYNTQIPGDSGSLSGEIGGHPKIKLPGTASVDFHFPSLTIGGTQRSLIPTPPNYTPISGSDLNSNNTNFTSSFTIPGIIPYIRFSSSFYQPNTEDGALTIDYQELERYISEFYENGDDVTLDYGSITYNLFISASVENYTASIATRYEGNNVSGDWTTPFTRIDPNANNREINISNGTLNLSPKDSSNTNHYMSFRIELKSPEEDFKYYVGEYDGTLSVFYRKNGFLQPSVSIPHTSNNAWYSSNFQGSLSSLQEFTSSVPPLLDAYPTISIQAHLKRTGSNTLSGGNIITSSIKYDDVEIFGGKTFDFLDSPILGVFNDNPMDTGSTINNEDDMYFIEYSMSAYDKVVEDPINTLNNRFKVEFIENGDPESKILVEQRLDLPNDGNFDLTGSILINHGNVDEPTQLGNTILFEPFIVPNSSSTGIVHLTGSFSYPFEYDDVFRMGVEINKSFGAGLTITEYSMSIFPSSSIYSPLSTLPSYGNYKSPTPNGFIIPSYYGVDILPFNLALNCQPLLNNYNDSRENPFLMDVSFNNTSGSIQPINFTQILNNTADKASTPLSNYTSISSIRPKYQGTKTTSNEYNIWSIQDVDTYGKNPVIELKDAYFGYFTNMKDLYPLVNDKISLDLTYLLDEQSNAIPPSLEGFGINILEKTFPLANPISIGFISSSIYAQELDDSYSIHKITSKPSPILYSQTSSAGYTTELPLTGSGRISMYDNNDSNTFVDYTFTAQGTSSFEDDYGVNQQFGTYTQIINPTEDISINPYDAGVYVNPYSNGTLTFTDSNGKTVESNPQNVSIQTSFATSFLYEADEPELEFNLQMLVNDSPVNFNLEDISLKVYRVGQDPIEAGSILGSGINKLIRFISNTTTSGKYFFRRPTNAYKNTNVGAYNKDMGGYYAVIENVPLETFLIQKGLYTKGQGGSKLNGNITGLEFIIKANSGNYIFKDDDTSQFKLTINLFKSRQKAGNVLFPDDYTGPIFPSKVSTIGERTALLAGNNIGSAPFWVYTGSTGGGSSIEDQSILVMSSSNINEAYGGDFYQGPLKYQPGPSEYFDNGVEPSSTQFPKINNSISFLPGDEIRFGNNENHSYIIKSVTNPESNIEGDGKGRIKIKLDREVPQSINKDFFLIRRYTPKASSFIIDTPFPYSAESSGSSASGIIYPTFPTEYVKNSGSLIITDLISKGVIT